ncbi:MAG TPA: hypothetical protein VHS09_16770 [Polyangiaceae bacterium]|nr:hypothetical protein [Polyangiaceae bacterium]
MRRRAWGRLGVCAFALLVARIATPTWCGYDADRWLDGDAELPRQLAGGLLAFEASDDGARAAPAGDRFAGEWALVTHQMIALGLAQIALAHPEERARLGPEITRAALKSFRPEMRDFGTRAWHGEDAMASLDGPDGHAYLSYAALAIGMARLLDPGFPPDVAARHDALIAAYERRLLASPTGLIETYPGEAYPTDCAAVAGAIAVHGRATGRDHAKVLARWAALVRAKQIDPASGLVVQRMDAWTGRAHDAPRGSGTALAAYFAGFADRSIARELAEGVFRHESTLWDFGAIDEYAPGHAGTGDVDSGPVLLGVSVSATGFALAPARAHGHRASFERLYRTTVLFGAPETSGGTLRFLSGGPIGNAMLLAMLTSGPEVAP